MVGIKVHLEAHARTGTFGALSSNQALRRNEMLLAGHAVTDLASLGKVVVLAPEFGPLALQHLNAPAMAREGYLGWKVVREHQQRSADRRVPSWDDILLEAPVPWELDELGTK